MLGQAKLRSEQTLRRGCTQTDNQLRTNGGNLCFKPGAAGRYFQRVRLLVQSNFAARFPLEMLNSIGDIHLGSIDARGFEALIKQLTSGPDKWLPLPVFAISRLFTHHKNGGMSATFPEDNLRRFPI